MSNFILILALYIYKQSYPDALIYVPFILYNLLFRPKNAQYINNTVCIVNYSYMFRCLMFIGPCNIVIN